MTAMTTIALHPVPRRAVVAREQLRAVGVALRREGVLFLGALAILAALAIVATVRSAGVPTHHANFTYGLGAAIPVALVGFFLPFSVWRAEDPSRRAYLWSMPVARGPHTVMKVASGWLWLMVAVAVYLLVFAGFIVLLPIIASEAIPTDAWAAAWEWMVPFTAASVAYLIGSIAVVGSDHPWRWMGGVGILYVVVLLFLNQLGLSEVQRALGSVTNGYVGLYAAIFGNVQVVRHAGPVAAHLGHLEAMRHGDPSIVRWLSATAVWGAAGIISVWLVSYNRFGPDARPRA